MAEVIVPVKFPSEEDLEHFLSSCDAPIDPATTSVEKASDLFAHSVEQSRNKKIAKDARNTAMMSLVPVVMPRSKDTK
jgi:hypothetical protein